MYGVAGLFLSLNPPAPPPPPTSQPPPPPPATTMYETSLLTGCNEAEQTVKVPGLVNV